MQRSSKTRSFSEWSGRIAPDRAVASPAEVKAFYSARDEAVKAAGIEPLPPDEDIRERVQRALIGGKE